jgi:hypothetical protein
LGCDWKDKWKEQYRCEMGYTCRECSAMNYSGDPSGRVREDYEENDSKSKERQEERTWLLHHRVHLEGPNV